MRLRDHPTDARLNSFDHLMIAYEVNRIHGAESWGEHAPEIRRRATESLLLELRHVSGPAHQEAAEARRSLEAGEVTEALAILNILLNRGSSDDL